MYNRYFTVIASTVGFGGNHVELHTSLVNWITSDIENNDPFCIIRLMYIYSHGFGGTDNARITIVEPANKVI